MGTFRRARNALLCRQGAELRNPRGWTGLLVATGPERNAHENTGRRRISRGSGVAYGQAPTAPATSPPACPVTTQVESTAIAPDDMECWRRLLRLDVGCPDDL